MRLAASFVVFLVAAGCQPSQTLLDDKPTVADDTSIDADADGFAASIDCDDTDPRVFPGATERCDGRDTNCDGEIDVGARDTQIWFADSDGDGFGSPDHTVHACSANPGFVAEDTDCNDADPGAFPGAVERCDGVDNDCDGRVDIDAVDPKTWFQDADGDGFGDVQTGIIACELGRGFVENDDDCDDSDGTVAPGASELCDGIDNDCDGDIDIGAADGQLWFADFDYDGFGDPNNAAFTCDPLPGFIGDNTDCDDDNASVSPAAVELCDGIDNNCDDQSDSGVAGSDAICAVQDCLAVLDAEPNSIDGVYTIRPTGDPMDVYCDMTTDGGGWTLALLINSQSTGPFGDFGSSHVNVEDLQTGPSAASGEGADVKAGWFDIDSASYGALQLRSYANGVQTWASQDIDPNELRIGFGDNGYLLYNDSNGYYWCGGDQSYTDSGVGQVNRPEGAPGDCKGHGSLGSGWDFSSSTSGNGGLTLCGGDASTWMHSTPGSGAVTYGNPGAAQALWIR